MSVGAWSHLAGLDGHNTVRAHTAVEKINKKAAPQNSIIYKMNAMAMCVVLCCADCGSTLHDAVCCLLYGGAIDENSPFTIDINFNFKRPCSSQLCGAHMDHRRARARHHQTMVGRTALNTFHFGAETDNAAVIRRLFDSAAAQCVAVMM